jgi:predicted transposase/invertase (TIGR01784 family)
MLGFARVADSTQPHDALFKKTFSDEQHAAAEFRALLPARLVALTDFSTLTLCPGSFVDEALAGSQSDLLFSARVAGKPALLYILFEHQSSADKLMPLRLLRYVVRILERHVEGKHAAEALPLPVVVPLVLHHSDTGWNVSRRLEELFDQDLAVQAGIQELLPRLTFVLDDLSGLQDDDLQARALGLVPALTLWALRDARSATRLPRSFTRWIDAIAELQAAPNGREAFWTIFRYITLVADDSIVTTLAEAVPPAKPHLKDALMTFAEKWMAEGEAKGKAEGKAEGKADALRKLLTLKFGPLPEAALDRIAMATPTDLDRWLERVLSGDSLDTVLIA